MQNFEENLASRVNGSLQPLLGVTVTVKTAMGLLATIYSDNGATTQGNPMTTDANGRFGFYAANGDYVLTFSGPQIQTYERPIDLYDPDDAQPLTQAQAALPSAASRLGFQASGEGSVGRTIENKLQETVSVKDKGAVGDGVTDDSAAFQAAVNSLPAAGGRISVLGGNYVVNTAPVVGTKSVYWDFGPDVAITGTQTTFPKMATNGDCTVAGPYFRSQRANTTIDGAASFAMAIESIQPVSDTNNGHGALYVGAQTNALGEFSINSAINAVATANAGSSGNVFGIEIDVATFATPGTGTQFGLLISGFGGNDCKFGIRINRHDGGTSKYLYGLAIAHSRIGIFVDDKNAALENGLLLGDAPTRYPNQMVQALQISNGGGVMLLQRKTNTAPTGDFISCINANNTDQLFKVDVVGLMMAKRGKFTGTGVGLQVENNAGLTNGLVLGTPPTIYGNNMLMATQISNSGGVILMQRATNTAPTGNFLAGINADNTQQLFSVDVLGNSSWNTVTAQQVTAAGAAIAVAAGRLSMGSSTATTATAGAASLPANPLGFLNAYLGGTPIKVPYYAA